MWLYIFFLTISLPLFYNFLNVKFPSNYEIILYLCCESFIILRSPLSLVQQTSLIIIYNNSLFPYMKVTYLKILTLLKEHEMTTCENSLYISNHLWVKSHALLQT